MKEGGLFATFCGQLIDPPRSEGFLFEGVADFLTTGGKKKKPASWEDT